MKLMPAARTRQRAPGRVKSLLLGWLGIPITLTDHSFWSTYYGAESSSGKSVTADTALKLSAVWGCVRLLAGTISTLPLGFFERLPDGGRKPATDHALYEILHHQPNADMTAVQFWEAFVTSMLLWGNAYAEKNQMGDRVVSLDLLLPDRIALRRLKSGALEYRYHDLDGRLRVISEERIMHVPALTTDGRCGFSPIRQGANVFGTALATDEAAAKSFTNGLLPAVYFKMESTLTPAQRTEFRGNLEALRGSLNAGRSPLLESGMTAEAISINPRDAQLLESRAWSVEEICRWFGVPPFMVGHTAPSTTWGTGIEQQMIGFLTFSLRPWLARIEQAARRSLLTAAERPRYFAEFSIEGLLRADSAARSAFYSQMTQNGLMTRNEGRQKENMPPKPGGDVLTVQTNLTAIDKLNVASDGDAVKNAFRNWLREEQA